MLVDKQVELSDIPDGALYLMIDAMALGIRQFLTYEELVETSDAAPPHPPVQGLPSDHLTSGRPTSIALEMLRGHLSRSPWSALPRSREWRPRRKD